VITAVDGSFRLERNFGSGSESVAVALWDLLVIVEAGADKTDTTEVRRYLLATETREDASALETFHFVISDSRLRAAGIVLLPEQRPEDVIARGRAARDVQKMFDAATLN